jgi:hypothetical protein
MDMNNKVYVVTECGRDGLDWFSTQIGVYSTLEKAQEEMSKCFRKAFNAIRYSCKYTMATYEEDPMQTTILFEDFKGYQCQHMVIIDEQVIDGEGQPSYFEDFNEIVPIKETDICLILPNFRWADLGYKTDERNIPLPNFIKVTFPSLAEVLTDVCHPSQSSKGMKNTD